MRKQYQQIAISLILALTSISVNAADKRADYDAPATKEETAGFFSGIVLGGLAGGPPGLIVGGTLGALMGDGWHAKTQVGDLQADLYESQLEIAMMREQKEILQQEYQLARQQLEGMKTNNAQYQVARFNQSSSTACCDNTVLSLHFRSGSAAIETQYEEQLVSLVKLAQQMPSASVEITGYADRNGDAEKNLALSHQRSESVKQLLEKLGITDSSITTIAYGETKPLRFEQNLETDFFDRRVIVRLRDASKQMLTQSPDAN